MSVLVLAGRPGSAADIPLKAPPVPVVPAYNWWGFYLGGAWGGASGKFDPTSAVGPGGDAVVTAFDNAAGSQAFTRRNVAVGAEAGFNWQFGIIVAGLETDIESIRLSGSALTNVNVLPFVPFDWASNASANW